MMERLDARGLFCPLPVIRTQDRVAVMALGDRLEVVATDHGVLHDIPAWCRINGHRVVESRDDGSEVTLVVEVGTLPEAPNHGP